MKMTDLLENSNNRQFAALSNRFKRRTSSASSSQIADDADKIIESAPVSVGARANEDSDNDKQASSGSVMGMFFKVWSLVKVSKIRHQRRQTNEAAAAAASAAAVESSRDFRYISGCDLLATAAAGSGRSHHEQQPTSFRRSESLQHTTVAAASFEACDSRKLRLVETQVSQNSTSSGFSSASSSIAGTTVPTPTFESQPTPNKAQNSKSRGWAAKIKRSATTVNRADVSALVAHYRQRHKAPLATPLAKLNINNNKDNHRVIVDTNNDHDHDDDDDDDDDDDLYSTPMECAPSGLLELPPGSSTSAMVKSFSTQNFRHFAPPTAAADCKPTLGLNGAVSNSSATDTASDKWPQGNLFHSKLAHNPQRRTVFASASPASDECAPAAAASLVAADAAKDDMQLVRRQPLPTRFRYARLPLETGVHYHAPHASSCFESPASSQLAPRLPVRVTRRQRLEKSPSLHDGFGANGQPKWSKAGPQLTTFRAPGAENKPPPATRRLPSSASCSDYRQLNADAHDNNSNDYKLANMLMDFGAGKQNVKDDDGRTVLIQAVISNNLAAVELLLERGAQIDEQTAKGECALYYASADNARLPILKFLVDRKADIDKSRSDGSRLLDRLIAAHEQNSPALNRTLQIELLLQKGAKLSAKTWRAARQKPDIQLMLLQKLCQDGYYLHKIGDLEASIYRFEYALRRMSELEQQQLQQFRQLRQCSAPIETQQVKYQTYLGLARCERTLQHYKRAFELAQMAILVDSTSYEAFYTKAQVLNDSRDFGAALCAVDQATRVICTQLDSIKRKLNDRLINNCRKYDSDLSNSNSGSRLVVQSASSSCIAGGIIASNNDDDDDDERDNAFLLRQELDANLSYLKNALRFAGKLRNQVLANLDAAAAAGMLTSSADEEFGALCDISQQS